MAGSYPDLPSWKIPYDKDGTLGFVNHTGTTTAMTSGQMAELNDDDYASTGMATDGYIVLVFPVLMDIAAWCYTTGLTVKPDSISTSTNATNGTDGSWTQVYTAAAPTYTYTDKRRWRLENTAVSWMGVRAVKFAFSHQYWEITAAHLYGQPSAGQVLDQLAFWHPTLDERCPPAHFDEGDVPRSSTADIQFRVKNLSPSLTAVAPRVSMDAPVDAAPSIPGWHTISKGGTFGAQQTLADIGPGAISSETLTLRRSAPSNAALSLFQFRLTTETTGGWS